MYLFKSTNLYSTNIFLYLSIKLTSIQTKSTIKFCLHKKIVSKKFSYFFKKIKIRAQYYIKYTTRIRVGKFDAVELLKLLIESMFHSYIIQKSARKNYENFRLLNNSMSNEKNRLVCIVGF